MLRADVRRTDAQTDLAQVIEEGAEGEVIGFDRPRTAVGNFERHFELLDQRILRGCAPYFFVRVRSNGPYAGPASVRADTA